MAMKQQAYDHPTYITRHFVTIPLTAVAASVSVAKFPAFTSMKIKSIMGIVNIAGTNTAAGYDILNGTSSVGAILTADSAAGYLPAVYQTDISLTSGGYLDIKTKASSATGSASITVEFELPAGSLVTQ